MNILPLGITALAVVAAFSSPRPVVAGAYIFAGEAYGVDLILHPQGYTGAQNILTVEVCIDPTSPIPYNASGLADIEKSIQNNVAVWNQLQPIVGNSVLGNSNNLGPSEIDFESVALHELGHCIGLAHVNAASESGLSGDDANYTKATDGIDNAFNINPGVDGVRGTLDDVRGDDINLHWFRTDTNDPGQLPLPIPVDASTYDVDLGSLPGGHIFAQNLDRTAAGVMGHTTTSSIKTEAVMQQLSYYDEDQRRLTADGVGTILLAMSGADETAGTADDYALDLTYGGISSASSCDISLKFAPSNDVGLAYCSVGGSFISSPSARPHLRITTAYMRFGEDFNWFFNADGPCRQTFNLTTGKWEQIALSCNPGASNTVADVFGDDLSGTYDIDWVVFERDARNDQYVKLALTDVMEVGRGYWIKALKANQTVNVEGEFNGDADFPLESDPAGRYNMVGHRYWYDEAWEDVRVVDGASVLTLDEADPSGACQGPNPLANGCVMSRIAHKWNGAAYEAFDGQTMDMEGTLENFNGIWVKAFKDGISLRIPDLRSISSAPHTEVVEAPPAAMRTQTSGQLATEASARSHDSIPQSLDFDEWSVRLTASSGDLRDSGNVLGQLHDSNNRHDTHDLIELAPFGSDYLSIVFPHKNWGDRSGDYTSDFQKLKKNWRSGTWRFDVLSPKPATEVTLTWEGPPDKIDTAFLIDEVTGEVIDVQPDESYTFFTKNTRHPFTWSQRKPRRRPRR